MSNITPCWVSHATHVVQEPELWVLYPKKKRKIYLKMVYISFICLVDWFHVRTLPESPKEKQRYWPLGKQKMKIEHSWTKRVIWRMNECSKPNLQSMWVVVTDKQTLIDYLIRQPFNAVYGRVSTALNGCFPYRWPSPGMWAQVLTVTVR